MGAVLRSRRTRRALVAMAAVACAVTAPTLATAAPMETAIIPGLPFDPATTPALPGTPALSPGDPVGALAVLAPAIIGAAIGPADLPLHDAARPQDALLGQVRQLLEAGNLPPQIKTILTAVVAFLDGSGGGGPALPQDGPAIAQFLYPSIGRGCISATADSVGTALAVPGPAQLPPPGPGVGQAGFVFTALGTARPAPQQAEPMTVTWLNLDNRRTATQPLTDAAKINPDGPSTLSAIADTGSGRVVAVISGSLTTAAQDGPRTCSFLPTVGMFTVA